MLSERPSIFDELLGSWRLLVAIILGIFVGGLPAYSIGAFIGPLSSEFGWSATQILGWMLAHSVGVILCAPLVGMVADRLGSRKVAIAGLAFLSVSMFGTSLLPQNLVLLYVAGFFTGVAMSATSGIVYGRLIARVFDRALGTAFGLMSCGIGLAAIVGPSLMQLAIESDGWRSAYRIVAVLPLLAVPVAFFGLRIATDKPGMSPGAMPAVAAVGDPLNIVVRLPIFWILACGTVIYGICAAGVTTNLMPFLTSEGFSASGAASVAGLLGLSTLIGRLTSGFLIDRFELNAGLFMTVALFAQAFAFVLLAIDPARFLFIAIPLYGLTIGAEADCVAYATTKLFGPRWFSSIFAVVGFAMLYIGTGLGPITFSAIREAAGGYGPALHASAAFGIAGGILFLAVAASLARRRKSAARDINLKLGSEGSP